MKVPLLPGSKMNEIPDSKCYNPRSGNHNVGTKGSLTLEGYLWRERKTSAPNTCVCMRFRASESVGIATIRDGTEYLFERDLDGDRAFQILG